MDGGQDNVLKLVAAVVRRHKGLFAHYPEFHEDDLVQDMLIEVAKALPNYNPAYRFDTFVCLVVQRKLINRARGRSRLSQHEARYVAAQPGDVVEVIDPPDPQPETVDGEIVGGDGQPTLPEWLHMVYVQARRLTRGRNQQGWSYERAQAMAVRALMFKLGLSVRGARGLFEDRADLCRVLGFPPLPSRAWFGRVAWVG